MSISESMAFFGIMVVLAALPSTSVALVVTRSATLSIGNGLSVCAGIILGDLVFIALAILGLSFVAEMMGGFFWLIKVLGGLYLVHLGFSLLKLKHAGNIAMHEKSGKGNLITSFMAGFLLTLGDVKAIIFYASLFPIFIDSSTFETREILTVVIITILSVGSVKAAYAIFAHKLAAYAGSKNLNNTATKTAGIFMIGAGGYMIIKA